MDKLTELIEWMEGEKSKWLQSSIAYVVFDEAIFKAKELQADMEDILAIKMKECDEWRDKFENWSNKLEDEIKKLQTYRLQLQADGRNNSKDLRQDFDKLTFYADNANTVVSNSTDGTVLNISNPAQPTDQVTDHDRASTDQVPDKSYPAKTTPGDPHLAVKWAVVNRDEIFNLKEDAENSFEEFLSIYKDNYIIVQIIEP
jgi:hypothetical protein